MGRTEEGNSGMRTNNRCQRCNRGVRQIGKRERKEGGDKRKKLCINSKRTGVMGGSWKDS